MKHNRDSYSSAFAFHSGCFKCETFSVSIYKTIKCEEYLYHKTHTPGIAIH